MANLKPLMKSTQSNWRTPRDLFKKLDAIYHFGLDAAADDDNALCAKYYTEKDSALNDGSYNSPVDWCDRADTPTVWLNPPYGRLVRRWMDVASSEAEHGLTVVCLAPARTDAKWFQFAIHRAKAICFLPGRLKFTRPPTRELKCANCPHMAFAHNEQGCRACYVCDKFVDPVVSAPFPSALIVFAPTMMAAAPNRLEELGPTWWMFKHEAPSRLVAECVR